MVYGQIKIKLMTIFHLSPNHKGSAKGEPFNGSMENENATQIQFKFNVCGSSRIKSQMFLKFRKDTFLGLKRHIVMKKDVWPP